MLIATGAFVSVAALGAPTAAAKEITGAAICGNDGCKSVGQQRLLPLLAEGGPSSGGPREKAEHFVVRIRVDAGGEKLRFENVVVPAQGLIQGEDGTWMALTPEARKAYTALTRDREAFPAQDIPVGKGLGPLEAKVDEIVAPAQPVAVSADDGGSLGWAWLVGGGAAFAAVIGAALALLRRRSSGGALSRAG